MYALEIIQRINAEVQPAQPDPELMFHPVILDLRRAVNALPVDSEYWRWLRYTIWQNAAWFIDRIEPPQEEGRENLEALQQAALGSMMEASLQAIHRMH